MGTFLMVIGYILLVLAEVIGIGTFLYDWGVEDVKMGLAAWTGFITWIKFLVAGLIFLVVGLFVDSAGSRTRNRLN